MKKIVIIFTAIIAVTILAGSILYYNEPLKDRPQVFEPSQKIIEAVEKKGAEAEKHLRINIFAEGLGTPRVLASDPDGNILVSLRNEGRVVSLSDADKDGVADQAIVLADGLMTPHGLAVKCDHTCKLYIAEEEQISEYDFDLKNQKLSNKKRLVGLPSGGRHSTRTIIFLPEPDDDKLLISVGSSCDVCVEENPVYGSVQVYDFEMGEKSEYATGLRNSVFMSIHPITGEVWATEMGRDYLGDDLPPDEINIIKSGGDYGWPYCYGKNIRDEQFDKGQFLQDSCGGKIGSYIDIPAHSAPLGLAFVPEEGWPEDWRLDLLVAYHGSWNRTEPTGYKVVKYGMDDEGNYLGEQDFIIGWLSDDQKESYGRPVDILIRPEGDIFISDDKAGVIYRIILAERDDNRDNP